MARVTLVHPQKSVPVLARWLFQKSGLFAVNKTLAKSFYIVKSQVSLDDFQEFVSALEGATVTISNDNFRGLSQLSAEFRFRALTEQLSQFRQSDNFREDATMANIEAHISMPIAEMNSCFSLFDDTFKFKAESATYECSVGQAVALSPAVQEQLSVDACARTFAMRDASAVDSIKHLLSGDAVAIDGSPNGPRRQLHNPILELQLAGVDRIDLTGFDLSLFSFEALYEILMGGSFSIVSEDELLVRLLALGEEYRPLLELLEPRCLSKAGLVALSKRFALPLEDFYSPVLERVLPRYGTPPPGWNSVIIPEFAKLFDEFAWRRSTLLWRGSRDGFEAGEFHKRCDRHTNTLTVILDRNGNIFGGFTPVAWESRIWNGQYGKNNNCWKEDPRSISFLFTMQNPMGFPPRRFALRPEKKNEAIACYAACGPAFGGDVVISSNCNLNTNSATFNFGDSYNNDTPLDGHTFFTGSYPFQVAEIEVFAITP
jgi:hypothetical protein